MVASHGLPRGFHEQRRPDCDLCCVVRCYGCLSQVPVWLEWVGVGVARFEARSLIRVHLHRGGCVLHRPGSFVTPI